MATATQAQGDRPVAAMHEEEEEGSSSDESEEDVEPKLTYERVVNDLPRILQTDLASCIAVHAKFIALGTHLGVVHILDHQGNIIQSKKLALHTTTVNQISIDEKGEYIATCSNDGRIVIHGLYAQDHNLLLNMDKPVRAIAIDPFFARPNSGRRFVTADDRVTLHEKTFLSRYKTTVLHQGEGPIRNIKWKSKFIAWASDTGVRVYDMELRTVISWIKKDHAEMLRPELYRCVLYWKDNETLLVGWADTVKVCVIRERTPQDAARQDVPLRFVAITCMFTTDFYICGLLSMGQNLVTLTMSKNIEGETVKIPAARPALRVLEPHHEDYTEISSDTLSLRGFAEYRCTDYHLDGLIEEGLYFIVCPRDVVIAKPREDDDHIAWLLDHEQYEKALEDVRESRYLKKFTILSVGRKYIDFLRSTGQYAEAAKVCASVLGDNKEAWEAELEEFGKVHQLRVLAPYVPTGEKNRIKLNASAYEQILKDFLAFDKKGFLALIKKWPTELYSIPVVMNLLMDCINLKPEEELLESLGELYKAEKKYEKALAIYLEIGKKKQVFELIRSFSMFNVIHDKLELLMELDAEEATQVLLEQVERVSVDMVVSKLKHKPALLYVYLDKLFQKDPEAGAEHHGLLVELYAEFAPKRLLSFLRSSNSYPLEHALDICQQRNYIEEVVFLLGRMGNTKQALQCIVRDLENVEAAINFCKEYDDKELWEDLIEYSLDKPSFITVLLQNIGTHVDPILIIKKIPGGMVIPGLRDSLVKILQDYNLQISLREGCKKILVSDCWSLMERITKQQKKGMQVRGDDVCQGCRRKIITKDAQYSSDVRVFYCRHVFHEECLHTDLCSICIAQNKNPTFSSELK